MKYSWLTSLFLVLVIMAPLQVVPQEPAPEDPALPGTEAAPPAAAMELEPPAAPAAVPANMELIDVPNDDGTALGVVWDWSTPPAPGTYLAFELQPPQELLDENQLTAAQQAKLDAALAQLEADLAPLLPQKTEAALANDEAQTALQFAVANRKPEAAALRLEAYAASTALEAIDEQINKANERYLKQVTYGRLNYRDRDTAYRYLTASIENHGQVVADAIAPAAAAGTKGDHPDRFGIEPSDAAKQYIELNDLRPAHPELFTGMFSAVALEEAGKYNSAPNPTTMVEFVPGLEYEVQMLLISGVPEGAELSADMLYDETALAAQGAAVMRYPLGTVTPKTNYFNISKANNFIFAVLFATIILTGIVVARRNPHIFIRRIQGLEAVDEAIGRATEMGKPVLYLCGLDPLSTLPTIAAVNILGRVARRIADYDSELVVPCRDPVVLTVAQEVARAAYMDAGRPDAFREDKIFFVTDDQFAYTAATCAIMMREKPAANFFMGYYYAESLLLTETGAASGAIQIAGTDALHQLPFFITTCDYTLIGEELYAASAYLSREPLLLGSLKGQDVGKALVMLLIVLQTVLFLVNGEWNWLARLVEAL